MPIPLAAAVAAPIVGGLLGNLFGGGDRAAEREMQEKALREWLSINVPDPKAQEVILQRYQSTGELSPEIEQAISLGPSAMENVQGDAGLQASQMRMLDELQHEGLAGGMDLRDQAAYQTATNDANAAARGRAGAITDSFAARGQGGSGLELVAQMQNAQNANQTQANASLNAAAQSRQRALDSIMGAGQLAGRMQDSDFARKAQVARAKDAVSQFNSRNMQDVVTRNVNRRNEASRYNLDRRQDVANRNVGIGNQEQMYNKSLVQQDYENRLKRAAGASGQYGKMADSYGTSADRTANTWAGVGSGVGKIGAAYALSQGGGGSYGEPKTVAENYSGNDYQEQPPHERGYGYDDEDMQRWA